jgi:hypothetical protein
MTKALDIEIELRFSCVEFKGTLVVFLLLAMIE